MVVVLDSNHFREHAHGTSMGVRCRGGRIASRLDRYVRREKAGPRQVRGYQFMQRTIETLASLTILPFDDEAPAMFLTLEKLRVRIGTMDLKIAAICLVHDATLLTRNLAGLRKGSRIEGGKLAGLNDAETVPRLRIGAFFEIKGSLASRVTAGIL